MTDPFPALTEAIAEADAEAEKMKKIRDYAKGLVVWGSKSSPQQIGKDFLYILGDIK